MKKSQKKLGKGFQDIAHYFVVPHSEPEIPVVPLRNSQIKGCRIILVVDDLYPVYSSALVSSLGWALAGKGWETLLMDGILKFPRVSFMFRTAVPGLTLSHFWESEKGKSDALLQRAPRLTQFLPAFNLRDLKHLTSDQVKWVFDLIRQQEPQPRCIILRTSPQEGESALFRLATDRVFLVPSRVDEMIQSYQRIKWMISEPYSGNTGIVITKASNLAGAHQAWMKVNEAMHQFLDVAAEFWGYLPVIQNSGAFLAGNGIERSMGFDIAEKIMRVENKKTTVPVHSLDGFLKGIETLLWSGEVTVEEKKFFN